MTVFTIQWRDRAESRVEADYFIIDGEWIQLCRHSREVLDEMGRCMVLRVISARNVYEIVGDEAVGS